MGQERKDTDGYGKVTDQVRMGAPAQRRTEV